MMGRPMRTDTDGVHLHARAHSRAMARLREQHRDEFDRLYEEAKAEIGLPSSHPLPPPDAASPNVT
jgi:hypothetical protein